MARYQFVGASEEHFPSILTGDGVLVCQPGDVVDLGAETVDHARLQPTKAKATIDAWLVVAEPEPESIEPVADASADPTTTEV